MADNLREIAAQAVRNALSDGEYRKRLISNTHQALEELGAEIPEGVTITVLEDTPTLRHLVLPVDGELSDDDLDDIAGGCPII